MNYTPSPHINPDKIFLINRSELEGRFDPKYIEPNRLGFYLKLKCSKIVVRLKEVIKEGSYGILPPGDSYDRSLPIKFIRATELKEDLKIDFENVNFVDRKYYTKRAAIKQNDILLAVKGATIAGNKCVSFVPEDVGECIVNGSIFRMQINEKANPLYIAYLLNSDLLKRQMKFNLVANNAVDYLDKSLIFNLLIPLPSLVEQERIVDLFQSAYSSKQQKEAEAKALLDSINDYLLGELGITLPEVDNSLANRIFTTKFSEVVGERFDSLFYASDLSRFNSGKYLSLSLKSVSLSFKSGIGAGKQDQALDQNGIIQIRPTNIDENGLLKFDRNIYIPFEAKPDTLDVDDVLFNNTNSQELVGKTAILKEQKNLCYSNHITRIKVNRNKIVPDFLWVILNVYQKNRVFYSICTNWNNQSGIGLELLKSLKIPLPPIEKQNEIASHVQSIHSQAKALQLEAAQTLETAKQQVEKMILGE